MENIIKNLFFAITLSFFPLNSFGLKCLIKKENSLASEGGPFDKYKAQDQNSFGTCYANSTSAAIYAITGEEPSYHQVALAYTTDTAPKGQLVTREIDNSSDMIIRFNESESDLRLNQGGWECESLEALKKEPFVCKRGATRVENESDRDGQKVEFHEKLADFYDNAQNFRSLPKEEKEKLIKSIKSLQSTKTVAKSNCQSALNELFDGNAADLDTIDQRNDDRNVDTLLTQKVKDYINELYILDQMPSFATTEEEKQIEDEKNLKRKDILKARIEKLIDVLWLDDVGEIGPQSLDDPAVIKKLVESKEEYSVYTNESAKTHIYQTIAEEYNYEHARAKKRGIAPSKTKLSIRNLLADIGNVKQVLNNGPLKIDGDENFPSDIWKNAKGEEIDLEETLSASIQATIPTECAKKEELLKSHVSPLYNENIGGLCLDDTTLYTINDLFMTFFRKINNIGEQPSGLDEPIKDLYYNYENLERILLSTATDYKDLVRDVLAPDCKDKSNQVDKTKIDSLSCNLKKMNTIYFQDIKDYIDTLTEEEVNAVYIHFKETMRVGPEIGNGLEDHKKQLKTYIKGGYNATGYFTEMFRSTSKGRNFFSEKVARRLNKNLLQNLNHPKKSRPILAGICGEIMAGQDHFSSFGRGECSAHSVTIVGVKCENGRQKYQILNSWGDGITWVDGDALTRNIRDISTFK